MSLDTTSLLQIAWTQFWQITVVALTVALVTRLFCSHRPHFAYLLWILVVLKSVTPPLWSSPAGLFSWLQVQVRASEGQIPVVGDISTQPASTPIPDLTIERRPSFQLASGNASSSVSPIQDREPGAVSWATIAMGTWISGVVFLGCFAVLKRRRFQRLLNATMVSPDRSLETVFRDLLIRLGIRRDVRLVVTSSSIGPAVFGVWRPVVVIPSVLIRDDRHDHVRAMLAHELIHVRRFDALLGILQLAAQLIWWFNPLIWWANREARRQRESCCDEEVVASLDIVAKDYANSLLEVLSLKLNVDLPPAYELPSIDPVQVTFARLKRMMTKQNDFQVRTPPWCWAVMALAALIVLPGAALLIGQVTDEESTWLASQQAKFMAEDGKAFDLVGSSVDLNGNLAIASTGYWPKQFSEHAYVFDVRTGRQQFKLSAPNRDQPIGFGRSVAIDGRTAVVSALDRQRNATGTVFVFDVATSELRLRLSAEETVGFGSSVAMSDGMIIVGASGGAKHGAAYLFDAMTGKSITKLTPNEPQSNELFGGSVALGGNTAVVGAFGRHEAGKMSGAVYLFDISTGQQRMKLIADDTAEGDTFGFSVAIDGNLVIIGAPQFDPFIRNGAGKAYLFDATTGNQLSTLRIWDGDPLDAFGFSVSIDGGTAIVGALHHGRRNAGATYVFDVASSRQLGELVPDDPSRGQHFGRSAKIQGDLAVVSSLSHEKGTNSGAVYTFKLGHRSPRDSVK